MVPDRADQPVQTREGFDCERDCQKPGGWDNTIRAQRGCRRLGIPAVWPKPTARALYQLTGTTPYKGRPRDRSLEGTKYLGVSVNWEEPLEHPDDGCPTSWVRTWYVDSVDAYTRRRTSTGDRVPNPAFDQADPQIQAAVLYYEEQQEAAIFHVEEIRCVRLNERTKTSTAAAPAPGRRKRR